MLNYGPQNAWNQQLQSLVNQANAFLMDKDAKNPEGKISAYYNCIVDYK